MPEYFRQYRFCKAIVATCLDCFSPFLRRFTSHGDDRNHMNDIHMTEQSRGLDSIHDRHIDVHED